MKILLVDPPGNSAFPPLGLLKLGRFHKERGDSVSFLKGLSGQAAEETWDRIYVFGLFTFQWRTVINTLRFYLKSVGDPERSLFAGGPMATLMGSELTAAVPCRPVPGVVDSAEKIGLERANVDSLLPDFSLLPGGANYPVLREAWIASATRGCSARCAFCSVREVDPRCVDYVPVREQTENCRLSFGEKDLLVLLDNNAAASPFLEKIAGDILACGFSKSTAQGRSRKYVDFSQGFEPALFSGPGGEKRADLLSALPLRPVRIAWDFRGEEEVYERAVRAFASRGFSVFSTPVLYGFMDRPGDAYVRFRRIVELEAELGVKINIEPMGYIPPRGKRRPSPRERARAWGCTSAEALRFEGLAESLADRRAGDRNWFLTRFGGSEEEFTRLLLRP